jgi:hypothetical protein
VERLVLDNDALSHGRGLGLEPVLEAVMAALGANGSAVEKGAYVEMHRTGLGPVLAAWQQRKLLADPVDYRKLDGGDKLFREFDRTWSRRGLSKADRASLVLAVSLAPSGILTCEKLLAEAAAANGVLALDLFDLIRLGVQLGTISEARAAQLCEPWKDERRAGRPVDYGGSYAAELDIRGRRKILPMLPGGVAS